MRRPLALALVLTLGVGLLAGAGLFFWARGQLLASLPQLDGTLRLQGLSANVTVTRDALGIPTIEGSTRADVARATGFLHAQDRFFQMDLARRRAAGELAALVGERAIEVDRRARLHRFRAEAGRAVALLPPRDAAILEAYTRGVNSGLRALAAPPFEYLVLGQDPASWTAEDSLLVVLSMFITLQDNEGEYEATLGTMEEVLPKEVVNFLAPVGTEWDAPIVGQTFATPPVPPERVYDLRRRRTGRPTLPTSNVQLPRRTAGALRVGSWTLGVRDPAGVEGSNNFAVAGRLTTDGGALVANDMHLNVRVPNTWYRATLKWSNATAGERSLTGVTLPGTPAVVVGSNTHVAWGFTNTYADWGDLILLETDPDNPSRYRTPDGWQQFERHDETIEVAGEDARHEPVLWTVWGPVLGRDYRGRLRAYRWVAHSAERLAASVAPLESADTVEAAFDAANGLGTPGQNLVVADRSGRIGWSVFGSIPRRVGLDGRVPTSWADGTRTWQGWLMPEEYPRVVDPPSGRIWTANARVVDGDMLARLGDGSYEVGSRAHIIKDRLARRNRFTARDMLAIQLDAGADFLARWRDLALRVLTPARVAGRQDRTSFRDVLLNDWTGQASPQSAAYRLTRMFREQVSERIIAFLLVECYEADPDFDYTTVRRREGPTWKLATEQPRHLLDPQYDDWNALMVDAIDEVIEQLTWEGDLPGRRWSEYNIPLFRHPLSASIPFSARWLDMPLVEQPGDLFTPRMHWRTATASQRMVVSPGREGEGIMHMPTGQSGHPLSRFYKNSHDAWVKGEPSPFLPGPTVHTLTLEP